MNQQKKLKSNKIKSFRENHCKVNELILSLNFCESLDAQYAIMIKKKKFLKKVYKSQDSPHTVWIWIIKLNDAQNNFNYMRQSCYIKLTLFSRVNTQSPHARNARGKVLHLLVIFFFLLHRQCMYYIKGAQIFWSECII